jgi:hypothetical protein
LYYVKCTGKRDFTLQNFLFRQNTCQNLKFLTAEKLDLRKPLLFRDRPSSFCSRYPNIYVTELKECTIGIFSLIISWNVSVQPDQMLSTG